MKQWLCLVTVKGASSLDQSPSKIQGAVLLQKPTCFSMPLVVFVILRIPDVHAEFWHQIDHGISIHVLRGFLLLFLGNKSLLMLHAVIFVMSSIDVE